MNRDERYSTLFTVTFVYELSSCDILRGWVADYPASLLSGLVLGQEPGWRSNRIYIEAEAKIIKKKSPTDSSSCRRSFPVMGGPEGTSAILLLFYMQRRNCSPKIVKTLLYSTNKGLLTATPSPSIPHYTSMQKIALVQLNDHEKILTCGEEHTHIYRKPTSKSCLKSPISRIGTVRIFVSPGILMQTSLNMPSDD